MDSLQRLVELDAVARLRARDATLFPSEEAGRASVADGLGWTNLAHSAAESLEPELAGLAQLGAGLTDVVVLGMGGSSLAALVLGEVLGGDGARMHVLDTTSPVTVAAVLRVLDPSTTIYVVSSKSGTTIEPLSLYAIFREDADVKLGREAAGARFIAVTDPGTSLQALAEDEGFRQVVLGVPTVGGRFSALTAFGLVPASLAGIDTSRLLARARDMEDACSLPAESNPAATLAAFIVDAHGQGRDKLTIVTSPKLRPFGLWAEQLVAESLGKGGLGVVPVVDLSVGATTGLGVDRAVVVFRHADDAIRGERAAAQSGGITPVREIMLSDYDELGAEFVRWEHAVALAGALLGINPFDQPDVAAAKAATADALEGSLAVQAADAPVADGVALTFAGGLAHPDHAESSLANALGHAFAVARPGDYLALLAYLPDDPELLEPLIVAIPQVSAATGAAVTFELGPRYLHSTGQLHKGGPNTGVFVLVTTRDTTDVPVPGKPWGLRELHRAQAEGDLAVLAERGRRVLRADLPEASAESIASFAHSLLDAAGVVWEA